MIRVFTLGESADINTWSSLPYYLCAALEKRVEIRRINLLPDRTRAYEALRSISPLWRVSAATCVDSFRTRLHSHLIERRLTRLSHSESADLDLFLTFSFSSYKVSRAPVVHYCDRTYEHYLEENSVVPTRSDRYFIEQEKENLRNALCVLATNKLCFEFIRDRYGIDRVVHLPAGLNVEAASLQDPDSLIREKLHSKEIVFIAREPYRRGVDILIEAFRLAAGTNGHDWRLHIVGVRPDEVRAQDERIRVYGYLRKDSPADRAVYDDLLRRARLFVCPVRAGQPPTGAIREAQVACTPVVLSDVSDGQELVTHGYNGVLTDSLRPEAFAHYITRLVENEVIWAKLARGAHESIKERTWNRTASELLDATGSVQSRRMEPRPSFAMLQVLGYSMLDFLCSSPGVW
jgi:glycosyltransferase involved in cell wall biosynthesis